MSSATIKVMDGSRWLSIALWAAQIVLAALFGWVGYSKVLLPIADLAKMFIWPAEVPAWLVRFIGACELAGAIGLILPAATGIHRRLTALAALGLAMIMVLAGGFHVIRAEYGVIPLNSALFLLTTFVIWGRRDN